MATRFVRKKMTPNPGSKPAWRKGCNCPPVDNQYGRGYGDGVWVMANDCPLHGTEARRASGKRRRKSEGEGAHA